MRILMVEDEKHMAEAVAHVLRKSNYTVDLVFDGENGYYTALDDIYDLIILDIMLPKMDGITIMKKLRETNIKTPIIMLTAKGTLDDKILGLDSGADDYLPKPFETQELLARIRALSRRSKNQLVNDFLSYGNTELAIHTLNLMCHGKSFKLTLKESQTMELLMNNAERVVHKDVFIEKIWGYDEEVESSTIEVYISFLRKKLLNLESNIEIKTIRGAGYVLKVIQED